MREIGGKQSSGTIRILARVTVLKAEDGGRKHPFTNSYRPNHNFGAPENRVFYMGQVEMPEGEWVYPGDERDLVIAFADAPGLFDLLQVGRSWRIQEGATHVGNGQVLAVLSAA